LQWLKNPSQTNGDNLNNIRRVSIRTFKNKKREYLKETVNSKQTARKNISETYSGIK